MCNIYNYSIQNYETHKIYRFLEHSNEQLVTTCIIWHLSVPYRKAIVVGKYFCWPFCIAFLNFSHYINTSASSVTCAREKDDGFVPAPSSISGPGDLGRAPPQRLPPDPRPPVRYPQTRFQEPSKPDTYQPSLLDDNFR